MKKVTSVLLIVPWFKKTKVVEKNSETVHVIQDFEIPPHDKFFDAIMVDVELKNEWAEEMDEWFHEDILPFLTSNQGGPVVWCRESEQEQPDANT